MDLITEFFFEIIGQFILTFPGALVRLLFYWKTKSYEELLQDDCTNAIVGGFTIAALIGLVFMVKH